MWRIGLRLGLAACAVLLLGAAAPQRPAPVKPAAASGLRGAQGAKPARAAPIASPVLRASLPPSDAALLPADPDQCRAGCAHTYYFCLAGDDAPSCPQNWTACLASCNRAPIQPQTAPP
ncbi:MAG TPA: hypothetical protein VGL73_01255 [Caulobacteraceae bacterium]|jgi:hypothetical protein